MNSDLDDTNEYLPECYKGDKLFKGDLDWWHNAVVDGWSLEKDLYSTGYKKAGDLLADHVIGTYSDRHSLVFPIVFLYRQYLELRLKDIIVYGSNLLELDQANIATGHKLDHKLIPLWEECKPILAKFKNPSELEAVQAYIQDFAKHDPASTAFRYPLDKKGSLQLPEGIINIRNFRESMDRIALVLDTASSSIFDSLREKRLK